MNKLSYIIVVICLSERKSPAPVLTSVSSKTIEKEKRSNELDLVFFDTTSIYFEGEGPEGLAEYGNSKDYRPSCKKMVVGAGRAANIEFIKK